MSKHKSQLEASTQLLLWIMYELSQRGRPLDAGSLARASGLSLRETAQALLSLDDAGLVWAERCKLTMRGLALGAALASRAKARARFAA